MGRRRKRDYAAPAPTSKTPWVALIGIGVLVIVLAGALYAIFGRTGGGTGQAPPLPIGNQPTGAQLEDGVQVLRMTATDRGYTPNEFLVDANKPVRLIVDGEARGCASYFVAPKLGISERLELGTNSEFEFTPAPGRYEFSCSMGMFSGVIVAV